MLALDEQYNFLPETELNECVGELKKKSNEGPTKFISRFKTMLQRLETLAAADRAAQARRPRSSKAKTGLMPAQENGTPEGDSSFLDSETDVDAAAAAVTKEETAISSKGPKMSGGGEEPASSQKRKGLSPSLF